jgi:hypothetical protein
MTDPGSGELDDEVAELDAPRPGHRPQTPISHLFPPALNMGSIPHYVETMEASIRTSFAMAMTVQLVLV